MSLDSPRRPLAPDAGTTQSADTVIWLHAAFCSMALPMRAARGAWQRDIGTASIRFEPAAPDAPLPSGRILRLGLMHICDAAFRASGAVVELGEDAGRLAAMLDVDPKTRDLAEQWLRLLAARIMVSWDGGAEVGVFDARSRLRAGAPEWRSSVRLNGRFLAGLMDNAVALDRRVVRELSTSPAALDAYAWIRLCLHGAAADRITTTSWDELLRRFGTPSQDMAGFREAFEAALRMVFDLDRSIALAVDDEGVSVRHATPEDDEPDEPRETQSEPIAPIVAEPPPAPVAAQTEAGIPVAAPAAEIREAPPLAQPPRAGATPPPRPADTAPGPDPSDRISQDSISLSRQLTGLAQVIWLRRGHGEESVLVGVTPGPRFEAEKLTILAVEPMVIQVSGGLYGHDFERVSAWVMTNRDVIDDFWDGRITSFAEINRRVRKAPAPGWR